MKNLITVCVLAAALVLGCATTPVATKCEPTVVGEFTDHVGDMVLFIDKNCDQLCDVAVLLGFAGRDEEGAALYVPLHMMSCREAAHYIELYKRDMEKKSVNL